MSDALAVAHAHRPTTSQSHRAAVEAVIAAMRASPEAPLDLAAMAAVAGVSRYYLDRVFREMTGISPRQFQSAVRLNWAMRLLLTTERSVTDVCYDVGYESLGSFGTRFTRSFGLAPQKLRSLSERLDTPWGDWLNESLLADLFEVPPEPLFVRGSVTTPVSLSGLIFVGLFPTPIPLGPPLACSVAQHPGPFTIGAAPPGASYLLSVGIPWSERPLDFLLNEMTMRGALRQPIEPAAAEGRSWDLTLRPPSPLDPPINLALPFLIVLRLLEVSDTPLHVTMTELHAMMKPR